MITWKPQKEYLNPKCSVLFSFISPIIYFLFCYFALNYVRYFLLKLRIIPVSAHSAYDKAAQYFNIKLWRVPVNKEFQADVKAIRRYINRNTILVCIQEYLFLSYFIYLWISVILLMKISIFVPVPLKRRKILASLVYQGSFPNWDLCLLVQPF